MVGVGNPRKFHFFFLQEERKRTGDKSWPHFLSCFKTLFSQESEDLLLKFLCPCLFCLNAGRFFGGADLLVLGGTNLQESNLATTFT